MRAGATAPHAPLSGFRGFVHFWYLRLARTSANEIRNPRHRDHRSKLLPPLANRDALTRPH